MKADAYTVCLRLGVTFGWPDLYTLWFEDASGKTQVLSKQGRIWWVTSPPLLNRFGRSELELNLADDEPVVYDIAQLLDAISTVQANSEESVLSCLNFLDDVVLQLGGPIPESLDRTMVQVVRRLTEGESLSELFEGVGGSPKVLELAYAYLGRIVAKSLIDRGE